MTQTISSYQETVNTLQFGQKAKNVKTTVNVNEIETDRQGGPEAQAALQELAKAKKTIRDLQERNQFLEIKAKGPSGVSPDQPSSSAGYLQA